MRAIIRGNKLFPNLMRVEFEFESILIYFLCFFLIRKFYLATFITMIRYFLYFSWYLWIAWWIQIIMEIEKDNQGSRYNNFIPENVDHLFNSIFSKQIFLLSRRIFMYISLFSFVKIGSLFSFRKFYLATFVTMIRYFLRFYFLDIKIIREADSFLSRTIFKYISLFGFIKIESSFSFILLPVSSLNFAYFDSINIELYYISRDRSN